MKRTIRFFYFLSVFAALFTGAALAAGITQETVTVSVPRDWRAADPYKAEFVVPEGSMAFNFTVWADRAWGITDMSGGVYREIYSSKSSGHPTDIPAGDAESSEKIDAPPTGDEAIDPLLSLTLDAGTYIVWTEAPPGTTITLQYFLQAVR